MTMGSVQWAGFTWVCWWLYVQVIKRGRACHNLTAFMSKNKSEKHKMQLVGRSKDLCGSTPKIRLHIGKTYVDRERAL